MASFSLKYPAGGSYTQSWLPSKDPETSSSGLEDDTGMLGELMADGGTVYVYQIVPQHTKYRFSFATLTETDRANYNTFVSNVLGAAFDLDSGVCGPVTGPKKVKFAPEGLAAEWSLRPNRFLDVTIVVMDSL